MGHLAAVVVCVAVMAGCRAYDQFDSFTDNLLREVMSRMSNRQELPSDFELPAMDDYSLSVPQHQEKAHRVPEMAKSRVAKEYGGRVFRTPNDEEVLGPSIRDQEYLEHSHLIGHQYVQGGAGEGIQQLGPEGTMKNTQVVKTDGVLPAYCNPPNPCPLGYTAEDGCLEEFVNTAAFSSEYQAAQECMCDTEHMFDCPGSTRESEIDALAQSIQNEGIMDSTLNRIVENMQIEGEHKNLVAKKFFSQKPRNPYLQGEKLPVVAKKAPSY